MGAGVRGVSGNKELGFVGFIGIIWMDGWMDGYAAEGGGIFI